MPGLYVLGQRFQHRRNSNFIDGVGHDAAFVADHLDRTAASPPDARPPLAAPDTETDRCTTDPHRHYDVVVVGARAAGAATAMLLARAGLDVLVVDRSRYGADTLSTHALMRGGVLQLHRWGLLDRVVAAGTPPVRRTTFRYADERGRRSRSSRRTASTRCTRRGAPCSTRSSSTPPSTAGAEVRYGVTVTDAAPRRRRAGRRHRRPRRRRPTRWPSTPRCVDRRRRASARPSPGAVGAADRARRAPAPAPSSTATGPALDDRRLRVDLPPGRLRRRHPDQRRRRPASSPRPRPARIGRGGVDAVLEAVARRRRRPTWPTGCAAAHRARRASARFGGPPGYLRRPWGPGWALVGDAGYWKDPISAHGLTDALRDAELLARAIIVDGDRPASRSADALAALPGHPRPACRGRCSTSSTPSPASGGPTTRSPRCSCRLSAAMADEVDAIAALDAVPMGVG